MKFGIETIAELALCDVNFIENAMRPDRQARGAGFRSALEPAGRGRRRVFTKENAIEICFAAAFTNLGLGAEPAFEIAHVLIAKLAEDPNIDVAIYMPNSKTLLVASDETSKFIVDHFMQAVGFPLFHGPDGKLQMAPIRQGVILNVRTILKSVDLHYADFKVHRWRETFAPDSAAPSASSDQIKVSSPAGRRRTPK